MPKQSPVWPTNFHGGRQVVSMIAFYSDDPSSKPAETYIFQ